MKILVNISTEYEPSLYYIDTDNVKDPDLQRLLLNVIDGVTEGTYGKYNLLDGIIFQQGYEVNNILHSIQEPLPFEVIDVITEI